MATIKTLDFQSKLGHAYFVIHNTLNIIQRPDVQSFIVNTMMQGTDKLLQELEDKKVYSGDTPQKTAELRTYFTQQLTDKSREKVQEYVPVLLNQNLVMLCTIMEIFFLHILEVIIETEPKILNGLAVNKEITLQRILELRNYELVIGEFKIKLMDHFSRQSLREKFKIYEKIGLDMKKLFDYSNYTDEVQKNLMGYDLDKLDEIFDKRHNIVHKNDLPLTQLNELSEIKDFFEKIIFNLSTLVMDKYAILLDLQENLVRSGFPRDKIPVRQRK